MNEEINEIIISQTKSEILTQSLMEQIIDIAEMLKRISLMLKEVYAKFDDLKKKYHKAIKMLKGVKRNENKDKYTKTDGPSKKPMNEELQSLFKIKEAMLVSKLDIQRLFNEYIMINDLRDKIDRIKINPNDELKNIFKLKETDELTYLNLGHYVMKVK